MIKHLSQNRLVVNGFVLMGMYLCLLHLIRQEKLFAGNSQLQQNRTGKILPLHLKAQNNEAPPMPAEWGAVR